MLYMKIGTKKINGHEYFTTSYKGKVLYAKSRKELREKYNDYKAKEDERERLRLRKDIGLKLSVETYLEYKSTKLKGSSLSSIKNNLNKLVKYFKKDIELSSISTITLDKFFNSLELSYNSKKTLKLTLNAFFNFYVRNLYIPINPVTALELREDDVESDELMWTPELDEEVLEGIRKSRYKLPLLIMYITGTRVAETLAITPQDIDLNNKTISINKTLARWKDDDGYIHQEFTAPKNKYSNRIVYINDEIVDLLKPYLKYRKKGRIFQMTVATLNNAIKKINPQLHNHSLRKFAASRWYNNGVSLKSIKKLLGHSQNSRITLDTYASLADSTVEDEIRKLL